MSLINWPVKLSFDLCKFKCLIYSSIPSFKKGKINEKKSKEISKEGYPIFYARMHPNQKVLIQDIR
jgi:hypothetical protein